MTKHPLGGLSCGDYNDDDGDNDVDDDKRKRKGKGDDKDEDEDIIEVATNAILALHKFVTIEESDQIYYYKEGVYVKGGEVIIKKLCDRLHGFDLTIHQRAEIREHIRNKTYQKLVDFDSNIDIINVKNGLYNIQTNTLSPHDPAYLSLKQCPIWHDPNAKPKVFRRFVRGIVYSEDIRSIFELMAYTFYRANPFEAVVVLLGDGSNGKSVLFGLLAALHGDDNVSNVSIKSMIERPFAVYDLLGKNCNLDAELSTGKIEDTAMLKKITGQQSIRVEQKNQKAFDTRIYAKLWLSANKLPYTYDQTYAYYRRHYVIATPNTFDVKADPSQRIKKMDINLLSKLTTKEELSGIFNMLMKNLRTVLKNKEIFVDARTIEDRRMKYLLASDPIGAFIDTAIKLVIDSDERKTTSKEVMYMAWSEFCSQNRIAAVKKEAFGKILKKRFEWTDDLVRDGKEVFRGWLNRRLTPEYEKIAKDALKKIGQKYPEETLDNPIFGGI